MKKLTRVFLLILVMALTLALFACGTDKCTSHVDSDKDAKCDTCGAAVACTECSDADGDEKCDVCGKDVEKEPCTSHVDTTPKDAKCDVCGADVPCTECVDDNGDEKCDVCGGEVIAVINDIVLIEDEEPLFQFVLAAGIDTDVRKMVEQTIIKGMERKSGISIPCKTAGRSDDEEMEYEVLVGDVDNRGAKYMMNRYDLGKEGYVIKIIGSKIVINAGSDEKLAEVLEKFAEDVLHYEDKNLSYAEMTKNDVKEYYQDDYKVTSLSVNGNDMKGYTIAADITKDEYNAAAETLQDSIYDRTGYWFNIVALENASERSLVIKSIPKVYDENSFKISVVGEQLVFECAFDNKLSDALASFVLQKITLGKGDLDFTGTVAKQDISFVTYEDFGAKGDGKTDDFEAIYKAHVFANISGQVVKATPGKTYYIHNTSITTSAAKPAPVSVPIKTNTVWEGAYFIIDDSNITVIDKEHYTYPLYNKNIFSVETDDDLKDFIIRDEAVLSSLVGKINRSTTKIEIPKEALNGWEGDIMIIPNNSKHKVYRRKGYGGYLGGNMHECIVLDKDGNVSPETPIMYDYTNIDYINVYRLDESTAITLEGGTFETIASSENCVITNEKGKLEAVGGYINRGLSVKRSYTTVKNVKHKITGEIKLYEQVDSDGKVIKCGAAYHGFFAASSANHITFDGCELYGRRCFPRPEGGTQGTYDLTGNEVNKIVFKDCVQMNFWVTVDESDGNVLAATENTPGAVPSMASYTVNGKNLKMHWGIGGTNYCKNMEYIGSTLSRFDAHAGLYNGKIIDSTVNYMAITGNGDFIVHNTRYFAEGPGEGSNSLFHLRADYGSTWEGDIDLKDVDAYVYTTDKTFLFYHSYTNWYYGYQACFPSLSADNLNYYSIATRQPLPAEYPIYLTRGTVSATSKMHLPESHTTAILSVWDEDPDGYCDTCHTRMYTLASTCDECFDGLIDGLCDYCGKDLEIARCQSCVDTDFDHACDVCKTEYVRTPSCAGSCKDQNSDDYCDVCEKIMICAQCTDTNNDKKCDVCTNLMKLSSHKCADKGNGWIDEPAYDRNLDGKIDPPIDLDGNGIAGNTSISYTDIINSGEDYEAGVQTGIKTNLNMIRPPEYIKIVNNDGVDTDGDGIGDTGGYIYMVKNTGEFSDDPSRRISNGGYWGVSENWGGFLGSTKFYYGNGENDYFQGSNYPDQEITTTFKFY